MEKLDPTDIKLLELLQNNCNLTTKELAAQVNLSPSPVFERVKKLEEKGYIKKYIALLDASKLNKNLIVFCNVTLQQHTKEKGEVFVREITALKEVVECYNISGDYDFLLKVLVKDMKDYQNFVFNKLGEVSNIGGAHSTFVMSEIKNTHQIPLKEKE